MEQWKQISGFDRYAISSYGRVKRLSSITCAKAGHILKPAVRGGRGGWHGYLFVTLCGDDGKSNGVIHVLVAEAFIGQRPSGAVVNHKDGDRHNNRMENLEWVTQSQNVLHAYAAGLSDARGEANGQAKLTDEDVREMRRQATGQRGQYAMLSRKFGISPRQVSDIVKGKAWGHLLP